MQGGGGLQGVDADGLGGQHRAFVEALGHLHDFDAGDLVAGHDRPLDGGGPAPARQQRGMQVEAAQTRRVEHRGRQDLAEGHHHAGVDLQRREGFDLGGVAHRDRRTHGNAALLRIGMDRRGLERLAAPARRGRLGVDADDLVPSLDQGGEGGDGEVGRSEKGDAH